jgi:hypothetical protein
MVGDVQCTGLLDYGGHRRSTAIAYQILMMRRVNKCLTRHFTLLRWRG